MTYSTIRLTHPSGDRSSVFTCRDCAAPTLQLLARWRGAAVDVVGHLDGPFASPNLCGYCAWCGTILGLPPVCAMHVVPGHPDRVSLCPTDRAEVSLQVVYAVDLLRGVAFAATAQGLDHLAGVVRHQGRDGLDADGWRAVVKELLCVDGLTVPAYAA